MNKQKNKKKLKQDPKSADVLNVSQLKPSNKDRSLYIVVENCSPVTTLNGLCQHFKRYEANISCEMLDKKAEKSQPYSVLIGFTSETNLLKATSKTHAIDGRILKISRLVSKTDVQSPPAKKAKFEDKSTSIRTKFAGEPSKQNNSKLPSMQGREEDDSDQEESDDDEKDESDSDDDSSE